MSLNTYPYNPFPASTDKLDEAHNADLQAEVDQLKEDTGELREDVETLETDKTDTAVIAPEFDVEAGVYAVGDLVMYQGKLYEFTTAHETAGDWDSTEVTEKTVADEVNSVKSGLNNLATDADNDYIQIVMNGTDGQHYDYTFTHPFTINRLMFFVLRGVQSGTVTLSTALYVSNLTDEASVISSDSKVSYELIDGSLKVKVDAGANAWVRPVLIMTRSMYKKIM